MVGWSYDTAGALRTEETFDNARGRSSNNQGSYDRTAHIRTLAGLVLQVGSAEIVVAVPPDRDAEPVPVFATVTSDLHTLVAWLLACRIDIVAMELTGVFWIPIYELLE